jgi:hypothetical protein
MKSAETISDTLWGLFEFFTQHTMIPPSKRLK